MATPYIPNPTLCQAIRADDWLLFNDLLATASQYDLNHGLCALYASEKRDPPDIRFIDILLAGGADPNTLVHIHPNIDPQSVLVSCVRMGYVEHAKLLLTHGATPARQAEENPTHPQPLATAIVQNNLAMARVLVKHGADVFGEGEKNSYLGLARCYGYRKMAAFIRLAQANAQAKIILGATAVSNRPGSPVARL